MTPGAAGVEVAQSLHAETRSAVLPLVPCLDPFRGVFIVIAPAGFAVTIHADALTAIGGTTAGSDPAIATVRPHVVA